MLITNSRIACYAACPRRHDLAYNQRIRPLAKAYPLRFGTLIHRMLESWWSRRSLPTVIAESQTWRDDAMSEYDLIKAQELMRGYDARWSGDEWTVIHVEHEFRLPILGQHTLVGKLDALARRRDGAVYVIEHKTSSEDISPGAPYWRRLILDSQVSTYDRAAKDLGHDVAGCLYDVLAVPSIQPLKATPPEKRKYTKAGALYANQRSEDESPDDYRQRLREDIANNPDSYFQRATVTRLAEEEAEARLDLDAWAEAIVRGGYAPKNPKACKTFGMECAYLPICTRTSNAEDRTLYYIAEDEHEELTKPARGVI